MERGMNRRYPIGAELIGENETHFRVWAPKVRSLELVVEESAQKDAKRTFDPLTRDEEGYFSGSAKIGAGGLYRFQGLIQPIISPTCVANMASRAPTSIMTSPIVRRELLGARTLSPLRPTMISPMRAMSTPMTRTM